MVTMRLLVCFTIFVTTAAVAMPGKVIRHAAQGVPNEYIIVLADGTPVDAVEGIARSLAASYALHVERVWPYSLRGFLVRGSDASVEALSNDPRVQYVEQNATGVFPTQNSATQYTWWNNQYQWHLDRLDELSWGGRDGTHNMCTVGFNTYAFVIDTGIFAHNEFPAGSIVESLDFSNGANGTRDQSNGCTPVEAMYHGTAVASVLGGHHIGAAKPGLISLRVVDCAGNTNVEYYIDALEWIARPDNPYRGKPGVINHSGFIPVWDSVAFQAYGDAVARTVTDTNIPYFTSADNYSTDACRFSPNDRAYTRANRNGRVFVVGGTSVSADGNDPNDYRLQFLNADFTPRIGASSGSNGGGCVSIYAPATDVYIAMNTGVTAYSRKSGTSFASPAVAAIAARYMEKEKARTGVTPGYAQVYDWLLAQSQTAVQNTNTAPTYWMCVQYNPTNGLHRETTYTARPSVCPTGYTGPYEFPFATNTSDARMVFWDEGVCP